MNANSVASQIKVEFLYVRRYDKRNRTLLSNTFNALVVYNLEVLEHFVIENHTWKRYKVFKCEILEQISQNIN